MRRLLCADCGKRWGSAGTRKLYDATGIEPAEYGRIVVGRARAPQASQRIVRVTGSVSGTQEIQLGTEAFDCDACGAPIRPGGPAVAQTIWTDGMPEPPAWESEYLDTADTVADCRPAAP